MRRQWWQQIKAVIRLEIRKTFLARRGLWIYIVALLPVLIFIGYGITTSSQLGRSTRIARQGEKTLNYQDLLAVKSGMTKQEVLKALGKPPVAFHWNEHRDVEHGTPVEVSHENYQYSDGQNELYLSLASDKVESVHIHEGYNLGDDSVLFAGVFQFFFLRLAIFFGCLGIFMNLFRGEVLDRSLHFYFLAPMRREVLTAGKFLAGLLATCVIFGTSELLQSVIFWWHFPPAVRDLYLYHNHGLEYAAVYLGITLLACIGYGSFFLICGMLFRNPILPTAGILIWEAANPFLPALLKQFSVIYYLKALCPVDIPVPPDTPGVLALLISNSDPVSPPVAVLGLLIVAIVALYVSSRQVRRMEINYTTE
jgi:outer membrane protein assembly factor BamE (lipoprotein component of BamABCDE complex)